MKIGILADPEIPVPPIYYGGIERIIDMLIQGLIKRGHEITLFAHPDSKAACKLEPYPALKSRPSIDTIRNMAHVGSKILKSNFDLIHSFARLAYLTPLLPLSIPKVMSYQRIVTPKSVVWGEYLSRGTLHFVAVSVIHQRMGHFPKKGNWHILYNGTSISAYDFKEQVNKDAPLVFLGRVEEIKGAHLAIEVAQKSGRALIIAGNIPDDPKHQTYFKEKIAPHINNKTICYVGAVNDTQKDEILGQAAALLMPVLWEELFGIVMIEALACGTPVIGLNRGAVPEVVQNGVNGFVCESVEEMVKATHRIHEIDRSVCRSIMEEKFSDTALVNSYEKLYRDLLYQPNEKV